MLKKHMTKYTFEWQIRIHLLPSTGESEPSLLKLKFPKKPGGENCGDWESCCRGGNWRPRSRALISGSWGSEASIGCGGDIRGDILAPEAERNPGGSDPGAKGKGGLDTGSEESLASKAALAAKFSDKGRGRGKRPAASSLCSIISLLLGSDGDSWNRNIIWDKNNERRYGPFYVFPGSPVRVPLGPV